MGKKTNSEIQRTDRWLSEEERVGGKQWGEEHQLHGNREQLDWVVITLHRIQMSNDNVAHLKII